MKTYDQSHEEGKGKISRKKNSNIKRMKEYTTSLSNEQVMRMIQDSGKSNVRSNPTTDAIFQNTKMQVQAKLSISQPGDASEMQADQVAEAVSKGDVNMSRVVMSQTGNEINMKGEGGSITTTPEFDQQLSATKGQGQSLDESTKEKLESHTGTDLSDVKIHTGSTASTMSEGINAKAFTHGSDIYFKDGNYNPKSAEGEKLLSHEVAHTVQQKGGVERQVMRDGVGPVTSYQSGPKSLYSASDEGKYSSYWEVLVIRFFNGVTENSEMHDRTIKRLKEKPKENQELMFKIWKERPNQTQYPEATPDTYQWNIPKPKGDDYELGEERQYETEMTVDKSFGFTIQDATSYTVYYRVLYTPGSWLKSGGEWSPTMPTVKIEFISDSSTKTVNASLTTDYGTPNKEIDYWIIADPDSGGSSSMRDEWRYADSYPKSAKGKKYNQFEFFKTVTGKTAQKDLSKYLYKISNDLKKDSKQPDGRTPINEIVIAGSQRFYVDAAFWKRGNTTPAISSINIMYMGTPITDLPAEAFEKDSTDALIYFKGRETTGTKLNIIGAEKISDANERATAKYFAYMLTTADYDLLTGHGGLKFRDTEIDRIITVTYPGKNNEKKEFYYTFIVGKEDPSTHFLDVEIKRIGEKGVDFEEPEHLRVQDIFGYPTGKPVPDIQKWIIDRYGKKILSSEISGTTEKEVCDHTNKLLEDRAGKPEWFSDIYGITIKNASDAITEMTTELGYITPTANQSAERAYYVFDQQKNKEIEGTATTPGAKQVTDETAGTKDFQEYELKILEQSLQKMNTGILNMLKGTIFCRQEKCLQKDRFNIPAGQTKRRKSKGFTIVIFDNAYSQSQVFVGGEKDVSPSWVWAFTHELGHVVAYNTSKSKASLNQNYEALFNYFINNIRGKGNPINPPTNYSREKTTISKPETEYFPEAFTLYMHDPDWVAINQPEVYLWFKWMETNGKVPDFIDIQKEVQQKVVTGKLTDYK